jgi:predicted TIM-barrel fold metal-dependent hydrolase
VACSSKIEEVPLVDHHQHLTSYRAATLNKARPMAPVSANELIQALDEAGIRGAVVLSAAYYFDGLIPSPGDDYERVKEENDWFAGQVMQYPDRFIGLCSFNPLREYAVRELERCARSPAFRGVKLHLGTSGVNLDNPLHVREVRRVFKAANRLRFPLLVHTAASPQWGARQAGIFLKQLVPAAPDVQVVVAHLWGGAGYSDDALAVLAEAANRNSDVANLRFELAQAAEIADGNDEMTSLIARRMRQIGLRRIYYGTDGIAKKGSNSIGPAGSWATTLDQLPLTPDEFRMLAENVAPWAARPAK